MTITCTTITAILKEVYPVEGGHWWVKVILTEPIIQVGLVEGKFNPWGKMVYATQDLPEETLGMDVRTIANLIEHAANWAVREFEWQRSQWGRQNQLPAWVERDEFWDQWFDHRREMYQ